MKKKDNYWVDSNNNKWSCNLYSEERAKELSGTLINCKNCINCSDCSSCRYCSSCSYCSDCSDCSSCSYCSKKKGKKEKLEIPTITNIHTKVLEAVSKKGALDMDDWHSSCGTTHCRAGWVVVLAGEEGLMLEKKTSTEFAANRFTKNHLILK